MATANTNLLFQFPTLKLRKTNFMRDIDKKRDVSKKTNNEVFAGRSQRAPG